VISGVAKLISANGGSSVLQESDPIFSITFQHLFWTVGTLELVIAVICIASDEIIFQSILVSWFTTCCLIYRLGVVWVGYKEPCHCLGTLTGALHIAPRAADNLMKIVLAYLLLGSYSALYWLWKENRKKSLHQL